MAIVFLNYDFLKIKKSQAFLLTFSNGLQLLY